MQLEQASTSRHWINNRYTLIYCIFTTSKPFDPHEFRQHSSIAGKRWTSRTSLMARIWPLLFFTFLSFLRKYLRAHKPTSRRQKNHTKATKAIIRGSRHGHAMRARHWPELGLGADLVGGPELHAVDLGVLIAGGRQRATHHLVLMELRARNQSHKSGRAQQPRRQEKTRGGSRGGGEGGGAEEKLTLWATISATSRGRRRRRRRGDLKPKSGEDGGRQERGGGSGGYLSDGARKRNPSGPGR